MRHWPHACGVRPSAVRRPPPVRRLPPSPLWVWSGSGRLLLFSAAASLALPLLCSCCVLSLPFLLSACLLVPQASAPPWALYTVTLSRLFQLLVRLRLNSAFPGTGLVGLLVQGRLRGQGEMPEPQYASQAGPPLRFMNVAATDRLVPVIVSGVLKLDIKHLLPGALGSALAKEVGCMYAVVGCKVYGDVGVQSICLLGASLIRLRACLIVGSLPDNR